MPKLKTHKSLGKRIKISGKLKLLRKGAAVSHLRVNKSPRHTGDQPVSLADSKRVRRMLPYFKTRGK